MNEAYETCKRCNKVAGCFFLIISSVDRDMITKTVTFSIVEDFGFSMSPRDLYYQFHKNAPIHVYICINAQMYICVCECVCNKK